MTRRFQISVGTLVLIVPALAYTKPIAFAQGTTVMVEYGAGTMQEAQIFYGPQYDYSVGGGHVDFNSDISTETVHFTYARLNYLVQRWNLEPAQANVFVWGGAGGATGNTFDGTEFAGNVGGQADYETRQVYASLKTDLQKANSFSIRVDTLQLGIAPYQHDYNQIATWFVCKFEITQEESQTALKWQRSCAFLRGMAIFNF